MNIFLFLYFDNLHFTFVTYNFDLSAYFFSFYLTIKNKCLFLFYYHKANVYLYSLYDAVIIKKQIQNWWYLWLVNIFVFTSYLF
jgi:hypothetical protein